MRECGHCTMLAEDGSGCTAHYAEVVDGWAVYGCPVWHLAIKAERGYRYCTAVRVNEYYDVMKEDE